MNKEQINGTAKDIAGKVQAKAGRLVGNDKQEAKGLAKQVEGKTEKMVGDAKQKLTDVIDKI